MPQDVLDYRKPLPARRGYAREFYEYCRKHELRFQRCTECGTWRHIPRDLCAKCSSTRWEWGKSSGRGKVFSWTTVQQPMEQMGRIAAEKILASIGQGVRLEAEQLRLAPVLVERSSTAAAPGRRSK